MKINDASTGIISRRWWLNLCYWAHQLYRRSLVERQGRRQGDQSTCPRNRCLCFVGSMYFFKGSSINDVTQIWKISHSPTPLSHLNACLLRTLYILLQKWQPPSPLLVLRHLWMIPNRFLCIWQNIMQQIIRNNVYVL